VTLDSVVSTSFDAWCAYRFEAVTFLLTRIEQNVDLTKAELSDRLATYGFLFPALQAGVASTKRVSRKHTSKDTYESFDIPAQRNRSAIGVHDLLHGGKLLIQMKVLQASWWWREENKKGSESRASRCVIKATGASRRNW
jgi:hypothetical protein